MTPSTNTGDVPAVGSGASGSASYLVKSRRILGRKPAKRRAFNTSTGALLWTPWQTLGKHSTETEARKALSVMPPLGAGERAIFHRGKRLPE